MTALKTTGLGMKNEADFGALTQKALAGDRPAENLLLAKLGERLLPIAKQKIRAYCANSAEREKDAQDLVQETLITIRQKEFKQEGQQVRDMLAWACGILGNERGGKIGNYIKKKISHPPAVPIRGAEEVAAGESAAPHSHWPAEPNVFADLVVTVIDLKRALVQLGKKCRRYFRAILEAFLERSAYGMAAEIDNMSYVEIHRCRERLKAILRKGGFTL
ncbi:hypothetical protein HUU39_25825 [candidate division KSB1 bacterium]|nr:hypothetical protein [candidate division KSB1 bacterium]